MRTITLDNEQFSIMVMRGRDGRELPITVNNWQEVKDAIELSVYESQLREIGSRPHEDVYNDFLEVNGAWTP